MCRKVTKGHAFLYALLALMTIALVGLVLGLDPVTEALTSIVALATVYIGGNVADNGVKGKYYQEGLNPLTKEAKDGTGSKD